MQESASVKTDNSTPSQPISNGKPKATKTQKLLTLLRRPKGASLAELIKVSAWQAHSVRGFISGTVKKRRGLTLECEMDAKGIRRYRIVEPSSS